MDENALALAQPRDVFQRMPRGHEDHRQRRRFLKREFVRNAAHVAAARQRLGGQAEDREAEDAIAGLTCVNVRTDRRDDAADFVAEDARVRRFAGIQRERLEHVAEIHARGFDVDEHFARTARRQREGREAQRVEMPALAGFEAQRNRRIERLLDRADGPRSSRCT